MRPIKFRAKMPEKEWLTVEEVAILLGLNKFTIYRHIKSGKLLGRRFGKCWRFNKKDFDKDIYLKKAKSMPRIYNASVNSSEGKSD